MRLSTICPAVWPFTTFGETRTVRSDADDLIRICGAGALEAAELNSWHEDLGLMSTPRPGHWNRVAREIARRAGQSSQQPDISLAA